MVHFDMLMASDLSEADLGTCETALIQLLCKNSYGLDVINDIRKKAPLQIVLKRIVIARVYLC